LTHGKEEKSDRIIRIEFILIGILFVAVGVLIYSIPVSTPMKDYLGGISSGAGITIMITELYTGSERKRHHEVLFELSLVKKQNEQLTTQLSSVGGKIETYSLAQKSPEFKHVRAAISLASGLVLVSAKLSDPTTVEDCLHGLSELGVWSAVSGHFRSPVNAQFLRRDRDLGELEELHGVIQGLLSSEYGHRISAAYGLAKVLTSVSVGFPVDRGTRRLLAGEDRYESEDEIRDGLKEIPVDEQISDGLISFLHRWLKKTAPRRANARLYFGILMEYLKKIGSDDSEQEERKDLLVNPEWSVYGDSSHYRAWIARVKKYEALSNK
jgi:hypothetical protein